MIDPVMAAVLALAGGPALLLLFLAVDHLVWRRLREGLRGMYLGSEPEHVPGCAVGVTGVHDCPVNGPDVGHRWGGWPGAFCFDCGAEDPDELCLAGGCPCPCHNEFWRGYAEAERYGMRCCPDCGIRLTQDAPNTPWGCRNCYYVECAAAPEKGRGVE